MDTKVGLEMTRPSNADLREALQKITVDFEVLDYKTTTTKIYPVPLTTPAIDQILALLQAREQKLLTEILGELPKKKNYLAGIDREYINGGNDMLGQVVSVIEKYREGL